MRGSGCCGAGTCALMIWHRAWFMALLSHDSIPSRLQFYEQQPPAKADPARPRKYLSTALGPPPPGLTQGGRKPGPAKVRQWARQVRFEQRHGGSVGTDDDEDAAQALWEQAS